MQMTFANGSQLLIAYVANNASNDLLTASSADGINWSGSARVAGQSSRTAPALPGNGGSVLGYVANNQTNDLLTTAVRVDGEANGSHPVPGQSSKAAPSLAWRLGNELVMAYVSNNDRSSLLTAALDVPGIVMPGSPPQAVQWTGSRLVSGQSSKTAPALVLFRGQLVMAYVANNVSNDLLTASSTDGINWTGSRLVSGQSSKTAPALVVFGGQLVMAYVANNASNDLLTASSTDGISWTGSRLVEGQQSKTAPALAAVTDGEGHDQQLVMAYVANNASNDLLTASSTDGITWTGSRLVSGQQSKTAPALRFNFLPHLG
jgi:fructose-1,6-bisphosphatase/inositol monophosphatase family enzyme